MRRGTSPGRRAKARTLKFGMTKNLDGKVALVTGASKGLGKAIAMALGNAGARVVLVSRDLKLLEQTAGEARAQGAQAETFRADVTDEAQVQQLASEVSAGVGPVQILINNAGINI